MLPAVPISLDALISARRRCTVASFPSWFGLALAIGFPPLGLFFSGLSVPGKLLFLCVGWGLAVPLFAVCVMIRNGNSLGALVQMTAFGYLLFEWLSIGLRSTTPSGRPAELVDWPHIVFLLGSVTFLLWSVKATWDYTRIASGLSIAAGRIGPFRSLERAVRMLRRDPLPAAAASLLIAVLFALPVLVPVALLLDDPESALEPIISASTPVQVAAFVMWITVAWVASFHTRRLLVRLRRQIAPTASRVRQVDPRPPILVLRSFSDDITPIAHRFQLGRDVPNIYPAELTLEEVVEKSMRRYGPVIAIGRPGEPIPPAGAAREYLSHEVWQTRVVRLIADASWVVVVLGSTPGVAAEYAQLRRLGALPKTLLILPPVPAPDLAGRWATFVESVALEVEPVDLQTTLTGAFLRRGGVLFITCRERDEECYELAVRCAVGTVVGSATQP